MKVILSCSPDTSLAWGTYPIWKILILSLGREAWLYCSQRSGAPACALLWQVASVGSCVTPECCSRHTGEGGTARCSLPPALYSSTARSRASPPFLKPHPVDPLNSFTITGCQTHKAPPAVVTSVPNSTSFFLSVTFLENPEGPFWLLSQRAEGGRKLARSSLFGTSSLGLQPSPQQLTFKWQEKVLFIWPRGKAHSADRDAAVLSSGSNEESFFARKALCSSVRVCSSHYHLLQCHVYFCLLWDNVHYLSTFVLVQGVILCCWRLSLK